MHSASAVESEIKISKLCQDSYIMRDNEQLGGYHCIISSV